MKLLQTIIITLLAFSGNSTILVPSIFSDHMVIQKNKNFTLFGYASEESEVTVHFAENTYNCTVTDGKWRVILPGQNAGGPYTIKISGQNEITLQDIYFGEVFLCGGSSQMMTATKELPKAEYELSKSDFPLIRLMTISASTSDIPLDTCTVSHSWKQCTKSVAEDFSAIGFMVARTLHVKHKIPIGIIDVSTLGANVDSWITASSKAFMKDSLGKFETHPSHNGTNYNGLISPLSNLNFAGILWYDEEFDEFGVKNYEKKFIRMIEDFRNNFNTLNLPFIYVQAINKPGSAQSSIHDAIPTIREAQSTAQLLVNTAMVNTIDLASKEYESINVIKTISDRMIYPIECLVLDQCVDYFSPNPDRIEKNNEGYLISYNHTDKTLMALYEEVIDGFTVPDPSGNPVPAPAKIVSPNQVQIYSEHSIAGMIRYLWITQPERVQLFNSLGNPATPFQYYVE